MLHVLRFQREALPALIDALNATGYGLTGGVHSRIDSTVDLVAARLAAGNIYVNRNIIGAVVGAQPFGGHGLSGTGPKAGGPLYLKRLLGAAPAAWPQMSAGRSERARRCASPNSSARAATPNSRRAACAIAKTSRGGANDRTARPGRRAQPLRAGAARRACCATRRAKRR